MAGEPSETPNEAPNEAPKENRRRFFTVVSILSAVVVVALGAAVLLSLQHNITTAAADTIELGMRQAQVEAILGRPAGKHYRWHPVVIVEPRQVRESGEFMKSHQVWLVDDLAVFVGFNEDARVCRAATYLVEPEDGPGFYIGGENMVPRFVRRLLGEPLRGCVRE